jgi:hypothetical protein
LAITQANKEHVKAASKEDQVFVDISSMKHRKEMKTLVSKPYCLMFVVELTNFKIKDQE